MRVAALMTMLAVALALTACDSGQEAAETDNMPMAESMPEEDMPMAGSEAGTRTASGEGTVTAVDDEAGTITIDHEPVPAVEWPAMTMAFEAGEDLRQEIAVGDEVVFDFRTSDGGNQLTSISKK
jgi:Cu(I)/Ag(I) efflux system protein CusF